MHFVFYSVYLDIVLDSMVASGQLEFDLRDRVQEVLLMKHRHQFQKREGKGLPMIRSLADIGRKMSARNLESKGLFQLHDYFVFFCNLVLQTFSSIWKFDYFLNFYED